MNYNNAIISKNIGIYSVLWVDAQSLGANKICAPHVWMNCSNISYIDKWVLSRHSWKLCHSRSGNRYIWNVSKRINAIPNCIRNASHKHRNLCYISTVAEYINVSLCYMILRPLHHTSKQQHSFVIWTLSVVWQAMLTESFALSHFLGMRQTWNS